MLSSPGLLKLMDCLVPLWKSCQYIKDGIEFVIHINLVTVPKNCRQHLSMTSVLLIRTVNHNSTQNLTCTGKLTVLFLALAKHFECPLHMFLWRTGENYLRTILKYSFLRGIVTFSWEALSELFCLPSTRKGVHSEGRESVPLPFRVDPSSKVAWCARKQTGNYKSCFPWQKIFVQN